MKYTHVDATGMQWRFVGSRPVSKLADDVMRKAGLDSHKRLCEIKRTAAMTRAAKRKKK